MLKSLTLQNFRSYGDAPVKIDFDRGILLFEGDIGSGKSSILYAIEFAFFGLGDVEGRFMLRGSSPSARVELEFEVGNSEYKIIRTIERRKGTGAVQTRGWISESGGKEEELKPTEMKSRILQILSFREKPGKSSSRIYRFAVFTPQEFMKEVLNQRHDERIETLRRAFGIEDYSFAGANTEVVTSKINSIARIYAEVSKSLPAKEEALRKASESLKKNELELASARRKLEEIDQSISEVQSTLSVLERERDEARQIQIVHPQLETALLQLQSQYTDGRKQLERYETNQNERKLAKINLAKLKPEYENFLEAKKKLQNLEEVHDEYQDLEKRIVALSSAVSTKETRFKAELSSIEDQIRRQESNAAQYVRDSNLSPELRERARSLEESAKSLVEFQKEIETLNVEVGNEEGVKKAKLADLKKVQGQLKSLDGLSGESSCPLCGQKLDKLHFKSVTQEYQAQITRLESEISEIDARLRELRASVREVGLKISKAEDARTELEKTRQAITRLESSQETLKKVRDEISELKSKAQELKLDLESRDFVHAEEVELSALKLKRDNLINPLKEYSQLRTFVRQSEESGLVKSYLDAELLSSREDLGSLISSQKEKVSQLESLISQKNHEIKQNKERLEQVEPAILGYDKSKRELEELEDKRVKSKTRFDTLLANVASEKKFIEPLVREVDELRRKAARVSLYRGYSSWLETLFLPAVENIESHVLDSIRDEFQRVFHRWFAELIEDPNVSASVDDRFTPTITQSGYDLDAQSLSGGERTAVALAYRLALNYMVKRANESMQTNLLILDEPTEGFSKEQTYRLRGVLEELECDQVILVSHERDLESLADKIYLVEKQNGVTSVKLAE